MLITATDIPQRTETTLRIKTGFHFMEAVEKNKRANNMTNRAAPMVAPIMRNGMLPSITAKKLVPGGGRKLVTETFWLEDIGAG